MANEKVSVNPALGVTKEIEKLRDEVRVLAVFTSKLLEYKESQLEQDNLWRERWLHAKKIGSRWTLAGFFIGIAGVSIAAASYASDVRAQGLNFKEVVAEYLGYQKVDKS